MHRNGFSETLEWVHGGLSRNRTKELDLSGATRFGFADCVFLGTTLVTLKNRKKSSVTHGQRESKLEVLARLILVLSQNGDRGEIGVGQAELLFWLMATGSCIFLRECKRPSTIFVYADVKHWVLRTSCEPQSVLCQFPVSQILVCQLSRHV